MSSFFKENDRLICIKSSLESNLNLGQIYKAGEVYDYDHFCFIRINNIGYHHKRFIKYSDRNKPENEKIMLELVKKRLIGK